MEDQTTTPSFRPQQQQLYDDSQLPLVAEAVTQELAVDHALAQSEREPSTLVTPATMRNDGTGPFDNEEQKQSVCERLVARALFEFSSLAMSDPARSSVSATQGTLSSTLPAPGETLPVLGPSSSIDGTFQALALPFEAGGQPLDEEEPRVDLEQQEGPAGLVPVPVVETNSTGPLPSEPAGQATNGARAVGRREISAQTRVSSESRRFSIRIRALQPGPLSERLGRRPLGQGESPNRYFSARIAAAREALNHKLTNGANHSCRASFKRTSSARLSDKDQKAMKKPRPVKRELPRRPRREPALLCHRVSLRLAAKKILPTGTATSTVKDRPSNAAASNRMLGRPANKEIHSVNGQVDQESTGLVAPKTRGRTANRKALRLNSSRGAIKGDEIKKSRKLQPVKREAPRKTRREPAMLPSRVSSRIAAKRSVPPSTATFTAKDLSTVASSKHTTRQLVNQDMRAMKRQVHKKKAPLPPKTSRASGRPAAQNAFLAAGDNKRSGTRASKGEETPATASAMEARVCAVLEDNRKPVDPLPQDESVLHEYRELNFSLSMEFNRCFHSREVEKGFTSFRLYMDFHKMYLDQDSRTKIIDLLVHGPVGHLTYIRFPCKARTRAGSLVMDRLLQISGMHVELANDLVRFGWDKCIDAVTDPIFCADGDDFRTNKDSISRLGDSLFVKAHCVEFFQKLLDYEQRRCRSTREALSAQKLLAEIALESRKALELAMKAYCHLLICQGPFLIRSAGKLIELTDGPTPDSLEQVLAAADRAMNAMGKIVSILVWVYVIVESASMQSVSHRLGDIILQEIQSSPAVPPLLLGEMDPAVYWESLKIRFLCSIDRDRAPQLRPLLADKLSVAEAYNCIYA